MLPALHTSLMVGRINCKVMSTAELWTGQKYLAAMLIAQGKQAKRGQLIWQMFTEFQFLLLSKETDRFGMFTALRMFRV